jgi:Domain of unknown function (DUF1963)
MDIHAALISLLQAMLYDPADDLTEVSEVRNFRFAGQPLGTPENILGIMQREEAIELIRTSALAEYSETLVNYLSPSARIIICDETENDSDRQPTSYFGGQPSIPVNATWPDWDKRNYLEAELASLQKRFDAYTERTKDQPETIPGIRERRSTGFRNSIAKKRKELALDRIPLAFLGQLSLREISAAASLPGWPHEGILGFFYDADQVLGI